MIKRCIPSFAQKFVIETSWAITMLCITTTVAPFRATEIIWFGITLTGFTIRKGKFGTTATIISWFTIEVLCKTHILNYLLFVNFFKLCYRLDFKFTYQLVFDFEAGNLCTLDKNSDQLQVHNSPTVKVTRSYILKCKWKL